MVKLKKVTSSKRKEAIEKAEGQIRGLMEEEPSISVSKLVSITGLSEYTVSKIYIRLRRKISKKAM